MLNHLHPVAIVFVAGAAITGIGAVSAQSAASVESAIAAAKANGTLNAVVADLAKTVSPEALAQAMVNQGVPYEAAIAALTAAGVAPAKVSSAMYAAVPAADVAKLDRAIAASGGELPATGAGPNTGTSNPGIAAAPAPAAAPFVGSTGGGGGGGGTTATNS